MPRTPVPPERREKDRADHKRRKYLRDIGRPSLVPVGPCRERIRTFHDAYDMSARDIALACGLSQSTVSEIYRGHRVKQGEVKPIAKIPRTTHDKVMAFEPDAAFYNPRARVDPTQTTRMLQALCAVGFGAMQLSRLLGHDSHNQVWRLMRGIRFRRGANGSRDALFVEVQTRDAVAELYGKIAHADPADLGGTLISISRARYVARKYGFAPPSCWDEDTIGDPSAAPEWTGACGTEEGYRIHVRETIFNDNPLPLCDACRAVVETHAVRNERVIFKRQAFADLLLDSGIPIKKLARMIDVNADTVYRWRIGDRSPRHRSQVDAMARVLGCDPEALLDVQAMDEEGRQPVIGHGRFNPYVFAAALNYAALSRKQAADIMGVGEGSVQKWLERKCNPSDKNKLTPLAEHFGVSVEVFYT